MSENIETTRTTERHTSESSEAHARRTRTAEATERVVDSALELGRVWARYGLSIGKMALETSATSLKTTASLLGAVADAFGTEEKRADEGEPSASETPAARAA